MHFCPKCSNMLYISLAGDGSQESSGTENNLNSLAYYCRSCGHVDNSIDMENVCVSKTSFKKNAQTYTHVINKYTKLDPTLPRLTTIRCPNMECTSNKSRGNGVTRGEEEQSKNEIIYIRYDDTNLKYVYLCAKCDTLWKTEQSN
jgi:DNA-directed RNA polymerase subunit M/transcription elongation factor TFIIS